MMTKTLSVYDPAMCCPTGVCGVDVDTLLVRIASDLAWLGAQGVKVERFNLAKEPGVFATVPLVRDALQAAGEDALPIFLVDGRLVMSGAYPTRDQLAAWTGAKMQTDATACCEPKAEPTGCCEPTTNATGFTIKNASSCC